MQDADAVGLKLVVVGCVLVLVEERSGGAGNLSDKSTPGPSRKKSVMNQVMTDSKYQR